MALFKKVLIPYNIYKFDEDNYLILKCSSQNMIKAPFDGNLTITGASAFMLEYKDFKLLFSNISSIIQSKKVKAGEYIGRPMANKGMTYIAVKLLKNNKEEDILKYLRFKDNTAILPDGIEFEDIINNKKSSNEEENKLKSTKSNKKKSTKKK